ncbi:hypothetical protein HC000_05985 [Pseudoalteromonas sp. MIP2626]|uniref:hypothetical protein n=1 Tax=Pseudoalteromonas sp. MIP2626 TaxID=2705464 RepID=UPI0015CD7825|nr:hypothetical protein [Pseudoalteromonas sp. MIP2626]NYR12052.1 hypothetical protein [Pseudoalteromonas sp. MIP2626]
MKIIYQLSMINKLCFFLKDNLSLLIMFFGAGLLFISNIVAKSSLAEEDFYIWNVLLTISTLSFSFCLLGSEQLFVRQGKLKGEFYDIELVVCNLMVVSCVLFTVLSYFLFSGYLFDIKLDFYVVLITLPVSLIVFFYHFYRMVGLFNISQLINNIWKMLLIPFLYLYIHEYLLALNVVLFASLALSLLVISYFYFRLPFKIRFIKRDKSKKKLFLLFLSYSFSLLVITFISMYDRLVVDYMNIDKTIFSNYVYLFTLLIFPFNLIATYFGFKEAKQIKHGVNRNAYIRKSLLYSLIVLFLFVIWFILLSIFEAVINFELQVKYIVPVAFLVFIKVFYSMQSAFVGIKAQAGFIFYSNLASLVMLFAFLAFFVFLDMEFVFYNLVWLSFLVYLSRAAIYFTFLWRTLDD